MTIPFQYKDKTFHYLDEGHGKVILLIHGFLESVHMWHESIARLKRDYRVIAIDLPGHGKSDLVDGEQDMDDLASFIIHLLESLRIREVAIVGHSMGGYVAMALADLYPKYVNGVVLFHSHAKADNPQAKINRGRAIKVVQENHKNFISHFIPDLFTEENRIVFRDEIELLQKDAQLMSKEGVISALTGMRNRPERIHVLKNAKIPFGFIIGQQDIRANIPELLEQIQLCHHAQVLMLKDVAHMGYIEDFESCVRFISSFADQAYR